MRSNPIVRYLSFLVALCMIFSFAVCATATETEYGATMTISASVEDNTVTAVVSINSEVAFRGVQASLHYDDSKLTYIDATPSLISGTTFFDTGREISFVGESTNDVKSGILGTITFAVKDGAIGNVEFSIEEISVADPTGLVRIPCSGDSAKVEFISYHVAYKPDANGSVSGVANSYAKNTVKIMTKPNDGYVLDKVSVMAGSDTIAVSSSGNTHTFTMPASDVTVSATFKENATAPTQGKSENSTTPTQGKKEPSATEGKAVDYNIYLKETENGIFTVDSTTAAVGSAVGVTVSPNEGYQTNVLMITDQNGNLIPFTGENDTYEFVMPESDVTVEVSFEEIPAVTFAVSVSAGQNGNVTISKSSAGAGSVVTIHTVPDTGYQVAAVEVLDASGNAVDVTGSGNIYLFTMPESDANVSVSFEEQPIEDIVQQPESENDQTWLWVHLAVLVVLIVLLIVILVVKKKKYQPKY